MKFQELYKIVESKYDREESNFSWYITVDGGIEYDAYEAGKALAYSDSAKLPRGYKMEPLTDDSRDYISLKAKNRFIPEHLWKRLMNGYNNVVKSKDFKPNRG